MKIGIMTHGLDRPILTGPANYTYNLCKNLLKISNDEFCFIHHNKNSRHELYEKGTELVIPKYLLLSGSFLKNYGFDIVHFRVIRPFWGILAFKRIVTQTDSVWAALKPHGLLDKCKTFQTKGTHWFFKQWLDFVITTSHSAKKSLVKYARIPEHKIKVIYNGVDFDEFKRMNQEELESFKKKRGIDYPYILHVSNYHPIKNPVMLIKSFYECKKRGLGHKLVIVGARWENSRIIGIVDKLGLENNVKFFGFATREELRGFYNGASLFFFPSLKEAFPSVLLEAMACECPVVSSNVYGIPEVTGDAALLSNNPRNSSEFSDHILQLLLDDSLRTELSKKSLVRARKFDWKKTAKETLETYKQVLIC
jgi:glycosyltransferase involved in cell wall biosynthesis